MKTIPTNPSLPQRMLPYDAVKKLT